MTTTAPHARRRPYVPRRTGIPHAVAYCQHCDWRCELHKVALMQGALHAGRTGHTVNAEQTIAVVFNPEEVRGAV